MNNPVKTMCQWETHTSETVHINLLASTRQSDFSVLPLNWDPRWDTSWLVRNKVLVPVSVELHLLLAVPGVSFRGCVRPADQNRFWFRCNFLLRFWPEHLFDKHWVRQLIPLPYAGNTISMNRRWPREFTTFAAMSLVKENKFLTNF